MPEWVLFFHGDLLTKERQDTIRKSRRIEKTPLRRFQFLVSLMGLFHFKMACADAIWRTYVKSLERRTDPNSLFQHVGILRPHETGKFGSKPSFRQLHDVTHHDIWASILECWELAVRERNPAWDTLESFAATRPKWDLVVEISEYIVEKYVASTSTLLDEREKPPSNRDQIFENQILRNRDELLYLETSHAMNAGDIGRVEDTFLPWIYIFHATGKYKYATHLTQFMLDMQNVYPEDLKKIIRMNLLCNPTGKPHAFRAVDWLVERNNLYTKVIFGGTGSSHTIQHIIKESNLIELYRQCHVTMERGFFLTNRTIHHKHPDMTLTISELRSLIRQHKALIPTPGRSADIVLPDQVYTGMMDRLKANTTEEIPSTVDKELEADDFMDDAP
ncbi:hypothetical protein BDN72DRAFT_872441 [Pluteus cervinus]|uniref:Uncharacterized protein n=1 Tax=Pluteus cervinus TaxID=181527 RepID=A0ACD3AAW1_9AGAR|nr:hypothetical protein BDN72DRAFT_872441 [Pluteus cervinus]